MKLIVWADRAKELYDLKKDPGETTNIALEHPELVSELDELLADHEISNLDLALQVLLKDRRRKSGKAEK